MRVEVAGALAQTVKDGNGDAENVIKARWLVRARGFRRTAKPELSRVPGL